MTLAERSSTQSTDRGAGTTAFEGAGLRPLAVRMLMHHAGPDADAAALAAAARRAYEDLARVLAPLIGQTGIDALSARALHIAQQEYAWLAKPSDSDPAEAPFTHVGVSLEQQDPTLATEAGGAVLATFTGLLVTFIGEPLTARLLRQAWPEAFSDASTKET